MVIKRIGIKGFGKIKDLEIKPIDGFNIIYGENEAGKSTIQWFIRGMFYGLKGGREKEGVLPPLKSLSPWNSGEYSGFIEYCMSNGEIYTVSRNFVDNSVRILDSSFNDITDTFEIGKDKSVRFAEQHLGLSEVCFEKTVFIKQMETKIDGNAKDELLNKIMNAGETGFEDVSFKKAEKALKDALITYVGTDKTTVRPLDKVNQRLKELKNTFNELDEERCKLVEVETQLGEALLLMDKYRTEKGSLEILTEVAAIAKIINENKRIQLELDEIYEGLLKVSNEKREITSEITGLENTTNQKRGQWTCCSKGQECFYDSKPEYNMQLECNVPFKYDFQEVITLKDNIDNAKYEYNKSISDIKASEQELNKKKKRKKLADIFFITSLIASFIFSCGAAYLFLNSLKIMNLPGITATVALLSWIVSIVLFCIRKNINKAFNNTIEKVNSFKSYSETLKVNLEQYREKLLNLKELIQLKERHEDLSNRIQYYLKRASFLTGVNILNAGNIQSEIANIQAQTSELEASLKPLPGLEEETIKIKEMKTEKIEQFELDLKQKSSSLNQNMADLALNIKEYETIIDASSYDNEQLQKITEEIDALESERERLLNLRFTLTKALDVLTEASNEIKKDYIPLLNEKMSCYIRKITDEKYADLRIDDKFALKILGPETPMVVPALQLSGGTADQMYLALRLALSDIFSYGGEKLPLIMDEVFAQYDDTRVEAALKMMNELSRERQIFLFTCKKREVELAEKYFGNMGTVLSIEDDLQPLIL
ncbi:MAG TPA: AAA family ATPase [Clostridiales bacterium]|nr:AAA family ATPase [Clostridiales bacterium]